jgi:hypothetical protein
MAAYESAITATITSHAPSYVVPADHKRVSRSVMAIMLTGTIAGLRLSWPTVNDEDGQRIHEARSQLAAKKYR